VFSLSSRFIREIFTRSVNENLKSKNEVNMKKQIFREYLILFLVIGLSIVLAGTQFVEKNKLSDSQKNETNQNESLPKEINQNESPPNGINQNESLPNEINQSESSLNPDLHQKTQNSSNNRRTNY
jgi:hypothetical protein